MRARAKEIYEAALREFPFDVEAQFLLVLAHDLAFEDEAAISELQRLLMQEPQNDYLWSYLGETYLRLGRIRPGTRGAGPLPGAAAERSVRVTSSVSSSN